MRFITTKALYRAFPELDHFSDEQCRTFVAAAKRGITPRLIRVLIQLTPTLIALFLVGWTCLLLASSFSLPGRDQNDLLFYAVASLVMLVSFGAAAIAYLTTRDLLLRRRIRSIMLLRGSCIECGYGLTGLPVTIEQAGLDDTTALTNTAPSASPTFSPSTRATVICPECGTSHNGDTEFGEVVADEKGTFRYVPSPDAPARLRQNRTARALRRLIKPALYTLAATLLLALFTAGGYELFLRRQAATARADLLTHAALAAEMAAVSPNLPSPDEAPLPLPTEKARSIVIAMETARLAAFPNETGPAMYLDFDVVAPVYTTGLKQTYGQETFARITLVSTTVFENLMTGNLGRDLDTLAAQPPVRPTPTFLPTGTSVTYPMFHPLYSEFRLALSANAARARLAMEGTDPDPFANALRTHLGILNHISTIPDPNAAYLARFQHSLAIDLASRAIHRHRTREWLNAVEQALATPPRFATSTDIDRISGVISRHVIADIFADPSNVRLGVHSQLFRALARFFPGTRVGTYVGALEEYESTRAASPDQDLDFFQRPIVIPPRIERLPVGWVYRTSVNSVDFKDASVAHVRALPLFLAIERYLLDNGKLPENLDALIPNYLAAIPIDPFTGKPLLYKRGITQPAPDPTNPTSPATPNPDDGRSYTIYSAGRNQSDDGGDFGIAPYRGFELNPTSNDIRLITMPPPR